MPRRAYSRGEPTKGFRDYVGKDPDTLSPSHRARLESGYVRDLSRSQAVGHARRGEAPARAVSAISKGQKDRILVGDLPPSDPQARTHVNVRYKDPKTGEWTYYKVPKKQAKAATRGAIRRGQAGPLTGFFHYVILKGTK